MLVMFGQGGNLFLGLTAADVESLKQERTIEYINPPHDPQLVKNIVVFAGKDRESILATLTQAGVAIDEPFKDNYRKGGRTDAGHRDN